MFPQVQSYLAQGCFPGGSSGNLAFFGPQTTFAPDVAEWQKKLISDAQTSGGLLLSVPRDAPLDLQGAVVIGSVEEPGPTPVVVDA
jgi:selenophosphate synthase